MLPAAPLPTPKVTLSPETNDVLAVPVHQLVLLVFHVPAPSWAPVVEVLPSHVTDA